MLPDASMVAGIAALVRWSGSGPRRRQPSWSRGARAAGLWRRDDELALTAAAASSAQRPEPRRDRGGRCHGRVLGPARRGATRRGRRGRQLAARRPQAVLGV